MSFLGVIELSCGIATGLSGIIACFVFFGTPNHRVPITSFDVFFVASVWMLLPLLAFAGSYLHAAKRESLGLTMVSVSGLLSFFVFLLQAVIVLGSWYYPLWLGLVNLAPSILAMMTMSVAFCQQREMKLHAREAA